MDRLVGQSNESHVIVDGVSHKALLDSGSMVTTMSESVFRSLPSRPTLLHLDTLGLTLSIADGSQMKYSGYVETTVSIPSVSDFTLDVPILVIPDNQFNCICPVIVGTNVLRRCKDAIDPPSLTIDEAWKSAINSLECGSYPVRCLGRKPVTLGPFQTKTIHGIARHLPSDVTCAVTETPDNTNISFTVCPRLMQLDSNASSSRIPVKICNITAKTLIIKPKALLCEITKARAVDNLLPDEKCTSVKNTPKVSLDTSKLSQEQVEKFHQVLGKWQHIFCSDTKDIGKTNLVKHKIVLDDPTPFKEPYRRIPPAMFEEVRQHVKEMLQAGVIRESDSPYSSNIVLIRKSNDALRFCVDWRKLNNRTRKDAYMLPRFDDTIDVLSSAKFFSKIDLHSAYWQVEVEEEDKPKTAFSVGPLGFYEWNRMGFGLTNAPATFQRLMEKCMGDMHLKECLIFLDDILIFSTTFEEHLQRLEAVFQRLDQHHLRLKRVRQTKLEVGDFVLVRNVGLQGKHKLADRWDSHPCIILEIPNSDIPVFKVRRRDKVGPARCLHRNMLLPFNSIPCEDTGEIRKDPTNFCRRKQSAPADSSSNHSESESDAEIPRYIIPQRRIRNPGQIRTQDPTLSPPAAKTSRTYSSDSTPLAQQPIQEPDPVQTPTPPSAMDQSVV